MSPPAPALTFDPPLICATLIKRYKRFLADVRFPNGEEATAHVANSGKMLGVDAPGSTVWLSPAPPGRKLAWRLHFVETPTGWAGVDTTVPNKVMKAVLTARAIAAFAAYGHVRPETPYGVGHRVDFLLTQKGLPPLYLEVKNCHLSRTAGLAEFPDCRAARSTRHMRALAAMVADGAKAAAVFIVQRADCDRFAPAGDLDPDFADAARAAHAGGVLLHAFACTMNRYGVAIAHEIPVSV